MNEDSRTDEAKGHLKKATITEREALKIASNDRFIRKLDSIQKVTISFNGGIASSHGDRVHEEWVVNISHAGIADCIKVVLKLSCDKACSNPNAK